MEHVYSCWAIRPGVFVILISSYVSDRYQSRGIAVTLITTLAVAGYSIHLATNDKFVTYGALYLMVPGIFGIVPIMSAWAANNSELYSYYPRRATSIAVGFIAANLYMEIPHKGRAKVQKNNDYESYVLHLHRPLFFVGSLLNFAYLSWKNNSKNRIGRREELLEKYSEDEDGDLRAWMELGDEHPDSRYTL